MQRNKSINVSRIVVSGGIPDDEREQFCGARGRRSGSDFLGIV
jgi:hypothetical protein